jgi:arginase family enzyme
MLCVLCGAWILLGLSGGNARADWQVPEALAAKVAALSDVQQAFLTSGEVLQFIPRQQLEHELASRDTQQTQRLLNDVMALAETMAFDPDRDMGTIPLNLASRHFGGWSGIPTPAPMRDRKRQPGPFSVHRYMYPSSGVPTFGGARVAIWPEDLVAGKVDVAIIGVPSNMSSGRRDGISGPDAMRALNTIAMPDGQSLLRPMEALTVVDYGNFAVDQLSAERTASHVSSMVAETVQTGAVPMIVGGDTSLLYASVKGVATARGADRFGLLHFSAHPDAEQQDDHTISDRRAVYALLEQGIINGADTIQFGLRGPDVDLASLRWLRERQVRYHTMAAVQQRGFDAVLKRALREVQRGPEAFFVSVDVSVVDPTDMVAAGRMVTQGLRIAQVTRAIREVCASKQIVGFEITDLAPMLDYSRLSVSHANAVLNACLNGVALSRAGLDPDYVHPLVLDHGQR